MTFEKYQKDRSIKKEDKLKLLNGYHNHLRMMKGKGAIKHRKHVGKLINRIQQEGGSWSSFTNWVKGAANTVGNAAKSAGNAIYKHAIKPAYEYAKEKPLTAIGHVANAAAFVPTPFSGALRTVGTAATTAGRLLGKGEEHLSNNVRSHSVSMIYE